MDDLSRRLGLNGQQKTVDRDRGAVVRCWGQNEWALHQRATIQRLPSLLTAWPRRLFLVCVAVPFLVPTLGCRKEEPPPARIEERIAGLEETPQPPDGSLNIVREGDSLIGLLYIRHYRLLDNNGRIIQHRGIRVDERVHILAQHPTTVNEIDFIRTEGGMNYFSDALGFGNPDGITEPTLKEAWRTMYVYAESQSDSPRPLNTIHVRTEYQPGWTDAEIREHCFANRIEPPQMDPPPGTTIIETLDSRAENP